MADIITNDQNYKDIANSIRTKTGTQTKYKPEEMASAIGAIPGGTGGNATVDQVLEGKTFTNDQGEQVGTMKKIDAPELICPGREPQSIAGPGYLDHEVHIDYSGNLVPHFIKKDINIFGVVGTYTGGGSIVESNVETAYLESTAEYKFRKPALLLGLGVLYMGNLTTENIVSGGPASIKIEVLPVGSEQWLTIRTILFDSSISSPDSFKITYHDKDIWWRGNKNETSLKPLSGTMSGGQATINVETIGLWEGVSAARVVLNRISGDFRYQLNYTYRG